MRRSSTTSDDERKRLIAFARDYAKREDELARLRADLQEERDEAIRRAHRNGMTMAQIAKIFGISQQRVSQIVRSYPDRA